MIESVCGPRFHIYYRLAAISLAVALCACLGYVGYGWNWARQRQEFFYRTGVTHISAQDPLHRAGPSTVMWLVFNESAADIINVANESDAVEARRLFPEAKTIRLNQ